MTTSNEHRRSIDRQAARKNYGFAPDDTVFLLICDGCDEGDLNEIAPTCTSLLVEETNRSMHFLICDNVIDEERQRQIDVVLREVWAKNRRGNFHVYATQGNIPDEFFAIADVAMDLTKSDLIPLSTNRDRVDSAMIRIIRRRDRSSVRDTLLNAVHEWQNPSFKPPKPTTVNAGDRDDLTLITRASDNATVIESLRAAMSVFPHYSEWIVATSPNMLPEIVAFIKTIPRVTIVNGTAKRELAGDLHYRMIDACKTQWIVNVDDDDLWLRAPNASECDDNVAVLHGDYLFLNHYKRPDDPRRIDLHVGCDVDSGELISKIDGSMWMLRTSAWKSVARNMTDRSFNHSDWRLFYTLLQQGWKMKYFPLLLGIQRRFKYDFPQGKGNEWIDTLQRLRVDENQSDDMLRAKSR